MQLAFVVDENMLNKSLDDCARRWVRRLSGYADKFNEKWDKEFMELVPLDEMLPYAGGDTDCCLTLCQVLLKLAKKDKRNYATYRKVQMPAVRLFADMEEAGLRIDTDALDGLGLHIADEEKRLYEALISRVPRKILRKHINRGNKGPGSGLAFSRAEFLIDILFTKDGFNLKPSVFTKGTKKLPADQRIPSTSAKDHLPFFADDNPWVKTLIEYQKLTKMKTTYVGQRGGVLLPKRVFKNGKVPEDKFTEEKGFWQYIGPGNYIHSSTFLHRTVTGRTASSYPNCQNFPKRGKLAKAFREIFIPEDGWGFIEADGIVKH